MVAAGGVPIGHGTGLKLLSLNEPLTTIPTRSGLIRQWRPRNRRSGPSPLARDQAPSTELADQWRTLTRAATIVAVLTSPALYIWFSQHNGWAWYWSLLATLGVVITFRGFADLLFRRLIPWPSLFGADSQQLREEDIMSRRRAWYWRKKWRLALVLITINTIVWLFHGGTWWGTVGFIFEKIGEVITTPALWVQVVFVFFLFIANFAIFMGPMLIMGISQIRGFEPGDAQWGVKLADVRGQEEAKEEVRRVVTLWQSGEAFERAGGKRERGLLFVGAPGTGKTMLAKAIATGFNSPVVSIPGSGFAQTFIGIDAIIVRFLAWKAKRLARKAASASSSSTRSTRSGCADRRWAAARWRGAFAPADISDHLFFGPQGALNASGDLILETRRWRERMFEQRAPERASGRPASRRAFPGSSTSHSPAWAAVWAASRSTSCSSSWTGSTTRRSRSA